MLVTSKSKEINLNKYMHLKSIKFFTLPPLSIIYDFVPAISSALQSELYLIHTITDTQRQLLCVQSACAAMGSLFPPLSLSLSQSKPVIPCIGPCLTVSTLPADRSEAYREFAVHVHV